MQFGMVHLSEREEMFLWMLLRIQLADLVFAKDRQTKQRFTGLALGFSMFGKERERITKTEIDVWQEFGF